ncbi:jumonji domain-containing 5 [Lepidopterella palustris CBS 459.81]|uniref:Jumonji domain-containing 5 n=1 Tax=Lepidopterella palustris CBS 459.81 TaxID=1314670 RepID=A0A8E2EHW4_9PEZI|nr:jumonji domain-containing 5 [Lepidopterella palustris CBS 459.81]
MPTSPATQILPLQSDLADIIRSTHEELSASLSDNDEIHGCGQAALSILPARPDACIRLAHEKLHAYPYKDVPTCWRRLYTEGSLWKILQILKKQQGDWVTEVIRILDMALILTGGFGRKELIEKIFNTLSKIISASQTKELSNRPSKRQKLENNCLEHNLTPSPLGIPSSFPNSTIPPPTLRFSILRVHNLSLEAFQTHLSSGASPTPLIITDALTHWPALSSRKWTYPSYLLSLTLDGRRLVPVEIGRSYTDTGWGQRIITFREFMTTYMFPPPPSPSIKTPPSPAEPPQTGYLAQHDLLTQIPSFRADICIPDYCYTDPPPPSPSYPIPGPPVPQLDEPLLNAWFGPAGTISPLHTDPYHNILTQVVGTKYIRLYAPSQTRKLYPRGTDENGVDMGNTSFVDVGQAMSLFPAEADAESGSSEDAEILERRREFEARFPLFKDAEYVEGVLGPGECLYIPVGWWHYVKSLGPSFSVSFWWN